MDVMVVMEVMADLVTIVVEKMVVVILGMVRVIVVVTVEVVGWRYQERWW